MKTSASQSHKGRELCASRVKDARKEKHLTQEQLAENIACSHSLITQIERGVKNLTLEVAEKIADVCGVRSAWLLGLDDNKTESEQVKDDCEIMAMEIRTLYANLLIAAEINGYEVHGDPNTHLSVKTSSGDYIRLDDDEISRFGSEVWEYAGYKLKLMIQKKRAADSINL